MSFDPRYDVQCPMPDCDELLLLVWTASLTLAPEDVTTGSGPLGIDGADCTDWKVECLAGHVVLVPGNTGCPCDDGHCPHDEKDYDWSDESRTFRPHDRQRLIEIIATIGGAR